MLKMIVQDAMELARATHSGKLNRHGLVWAVAATDSFRITTLQRVRELARDLRVPLVNHAVRVVQTAMHGVEISIHATLGHGVHFAHPVGVVIGGDASIGNRVHFYGNNTIGSVNGGGYPVI